jgi:hypothetical protein
VKRIYEGEHTMISERAKANKRDSLRKDGRRERVHGKTCRGNIRAQKMDDTLIILASIISNPKLRRASGTSGFGAWSRSFGKKDSPFSSKLFQSHGQEGSLSSQLLTAIMVIEGTVYSPTPTTANTSAAIA